MASELSIIGDTKHEKYASLFLQLKALTEGENDSIANLSNFCSAIKYGMNFFWVGFYIVKNNELVLGPFQGTVACTRIQKGKGVCGTSWLKKETLVVEDVDQFPGHIACSSASKSEIVIPIIKNNEVVAVLDIDDDNYATFDEIDKLNLEKIAAITHNWF
jgi:L-methionine (R)-S-oxide reductase